MLFHQLKVITFLKLIQRKRRREKKTKTKNLISNKINFDLLAATTSQGVTNLRIKSSNKQTNQSTVKPTEHTSIGGIAIGSKNTG